MSIFEKFKGFNKKNTPPKTQGDSSVEPKEKSVDVDLEKEAYLEELVVKGKNIYDLEVQGKSERFMSQWLCMSFTLEFKSQLLEGRKTWFSVKKEAKLLQDIIKKKINSNIGFSELYHLINLYRSLGYEDTGEFFCQLLDRPEIWNYPDNSCVHRIMDFFQKSGGNESVEFITRYINNILLPGYNRQAHLANDLHFAIESLNMILGSVEGEEILRSLAEQNTTFHGWFETYKSSGYYGWGSDGYSKNKITPDVFDEEIESVRLVELEAQYNEWLKYYPHESPKPSNSDFLYGDLDEIREDDSISDNVSLDSYESQDLQTRLEERSKLWEEDRPINFYGRFRARTKRGTSLDGANYPSALIGTAEAVGSSDSWDSNLNLLSGIVKEEILVERKPEQLNPQEMFRVVSLGVSEALCRAVLENKREESLVNLGILRQLVDQNKNSLTTIFIQYLDKNMDQIKNYIENDSNFNFPKLPKSAESFLVYHAWFNKTRELPDFRVLLAEKVRWLMANDLANNLQFIEFDEYTTLPVGGPSFDRFIQIVERYKAGLDLYKEVDKEDTPIYWEAIDKLEDSDAKKIVVFGRDGRFFFTALKASAFGVGDKEVKYVVVTRNMQNSESQEKITRYLRENGISLEFTFIDTGFRGSIPELVINFLAQEQGIELSQEEVDEKISLLASSQLGRTELSRKRRHRDTQHSAVGIIEERPQNMESPAYLKIDERGKLKPEGKTHPVFDQLDFWIVEHASLRNFSPRLNPEKRIEYIKQNPLEGLTYIQDYNGESIGTHPMELWEDKKSGDRFLIKGGPEHTLRADFVGQRFLMKAGLVVPETDLIMVDDRLKLKMNFMGDYETVGLHLPAEFHNSEEIQSAMMIDAFLGQYDRTPWNMMFATSKFRTDKSVLFIDNGASLFSRARGGTRVFRSILT